MYVAASINELQHYENLELHVPIPGLFNVRFYSILLFYYCFPVSSTEGLQQHVLKP